ncbi:sugar ABC transporter permease [Brachybacterium phenoliresistens]|uniref:Sugar ABC transporter permease n=1 Tax=Brachybacterium phenoliresistens TaxID=396014 RepID=Z9JVK8_9MICO|nr:sugar ABC transporter permease [Brachybacterium phenoliresistens]EWS82410.1 sugar ABC transporter permease [Brachybacterium phenoliresistens]
MSETTSTPPRASTPQRSSAPPPKESPNSPKIDPIYYFFLFPALLAFTLAITVPAIVGFGYSFTNSIGFGDWEFTGIRNYIAVFRDEGIVGAYLFTLGFALVTVIITNAIAFFLALGLTARIRFQRTLRTVFVLPMVISGIIIAYVFKFLFSNTVPAIAQTLGIDALSQSILANENLAWIALVIVHAWSTIPPALLIYIAGLVTVPEEVYEAASIDGASPASKLWHITLPLVSGYVVINTILGFKGYLNAYDIVVGLTDGGPGVATRTVAMSIIRGFEGGDFGYQMANAAVFFVISIIIAIFQLRLTRGKASFGS